MWSLIARRFLEAIPVLLLLALLTFVASRMAPGNPFSSSDREFPPEVIQQIEIHYGLDKPISTQFWNYLCGLTHGDLGPSLHYPGWSVQELIGQKLWISLELGFLSFLFALVLGVGIGFLSCLKPDSWLDWVPSSTILLGICLPSFLLGPLLVYCFALKLHWFPVAGWDTIGSRILPVITLGSFYAAYLARLSRASLRETLSQDYIRTARAKGTSRIRILLIHLGKNALLPVVAFSGPAIAGLLSGSFVVETIFNIPGLGQFFVNAAFNRDYFMLQGTVLLYAVMILLFNLIADLIQLWMDPRQRPQR
jgi:oligopeptide transport system permease protein